MNLRSWRSDLPELNELAEQHGILEESPEIKVLGMLWDTKTSTIKLQAKPKWNGKFCKRAVLSYANQHYDPLGFIAPLKVYGSYICRRALIESSGDPLKEIIGETYNCL